MSLYLKGEHGLRKTGAYGKRRMVMPIRPLPSAKPAPEMRAISPPSSGSEKKHRGIVNSSVKAY